MLLMYFIFPQGGYSTRVKAIHIINVGPWAESVITMVKFVMKNKLASRVSVLEYMLFMNNEFSNSTYIFIYI